MLSISSTDSRKQQEAAGAGTIQQHAVSKPYGETNQALAAAHHVRKQIKSGLKCQLREAVEAGPAQASNPHSPSRTLSG